MTQEAEPKSTLDVLTAALESGGAPPVTTPPAGESEETPPEGEGETPPEGEGEGETPPEGEGETPPEGEGEGETPPEGEGEEEIDPATGKTKVKAKEGEEEIDPATGKPKVDPAKKPDPLNDPIDARNAPRTKERIESLIGMVKERDATIAKADQLFETIENTGMSPDDFGNMLTYARLTHSDKPEDQEAAFNFLQSEYRAACIKLGKTDHIDLLAEHEDLRTEVEAGTLTQARANEIALTRARAAEATARTTRTNSAKNAEQEHNDAVAAARTELTALEKTLRKDPYYQAKYDHLVPLMQPIFPGIHPSKWAATFKAAWERLPKAFGKPVMTVAPTAARTPAAPLRPNRQPAGQGAKQPNSSLEALDAALAQMK